ncbi:prolipoprotein diacylglyceryl transferase [Clostridium sp. BJN0001]|uniref:prolipoprotein diacylglyceryl transferase n=1 Tax=Clostridium sp. BJN0001 TaxID=2930219 RepID=UPI001FD5356D|nr:prolipoprotein diacylglyceryl transferase [Clostridium sp. BJN0001]
MKTDLFDIFGIHIRGYGTMIAIGIIVASIIFISKGKKKNYDENSLLNIIIITVIFGMIGAKLLFIITEIKDIIKNPSILLNIGNGFVVYGGIIGGIFGIYIYCRRKSWNIFEILDMIAAPLAIAQGFGRIGCFLAGCCYGKVTTSQFGVVFPQNSLAYPPGIPLIPTQLYSSAFDFSLGIFLMLFSRRKKNNGKVLSMYLILYSIGRFIIEIFRDDMRGNIGFLSTSQFIAIITLIAGAILFKLSTNNIFKGEMKNVEKEN